MALNIFLVIVTAFLWVNAAWWGKASWYNLVIKLIFVGLAVWATLESVVAFGWIAKS